MSKKILVTGGAGFIGHHFIDYLLRSTDYSVVCLDRLDPAGDLNRLSQIPSLQSASCRGRLSICHHDLRSNLSTEVSRQVLTGNGNFGQDGFDHIVHMAAGSHVDRSVADPVGFIMDNVVGTANLFEFVRGTPNALRSGGKILYFSTDEVMGPAPEGVSFGEWDRFNPNNPYAASKAGGEALCTAYANTYGIPITVSHCTNVFGERQHSEKFIPMLIKKVLCREKVQIHSDPTRTKPSSRFYTYVDNVSTATLQMLEYGKCLDGTDKVGKYNITGEREVNNLELAQLVAKKLDRTLDYELIDFCPSRPKHDMRYALNGDALAAIGWNLGVPFEEGLDRTIKYYTER